MRHKTWEECTKEQQIERWQQVIRVLQNLSPHEKRKHFDMTEWGSKTKCGTVACAAGHAGMDSWFRRRGFKMVFKLETGPHDKWWDVAFPTMGPDVFFGRDGYYGIFLNVDGTVSGVIKKIKAYIKELEQD